MFVSNVLAHGGDQKYKRVKASNSRYQTAIGTKQSGPACMLALGFRLIAIDGQQVLMRTAPRWTEGMWWGGEERPVQKSEAHSLLHSHPPSLPLPDAFSLPDQISITNLSHD